MRDPRIQLKNPWIAGVLAFLVPGAGHLYQKRLFKAAVYFFCILGLYITGMQMADWKAVYIHRPGSERPRGKHHTLQFLAQAGVGLPAVCALIQNKRYYSEKNQDVRKLDGPWSASFEGEFRSNQEQDALRVRGRVELAPSVGAFGRETRGQFTGTTDDGEAIQLVLGDLGHLDAPVNVDRRRHLEVLVLDPEGERVIGRLTGTVPRPFWNWFVVPVDTDQERELHRQLGKFHELAMVFTWVAGLLNILAIWDALEGPAYGYGDEESDAESPDSQRPATAAGPKSQRAAAQASA